MIFDYFSPTDFKFAGIDVSTQQGRDGSPRRERLDRRRADAVRRSSPTPSTRCWWRSTARPSPCRSTASSPSPTRSRRGSSTGNPVGLNKGFVGAGSDNSRGIWDNVTRPGAAAAADAGQQHQLHRRRRARSATTRAGTWTAASGRYVGHRRRRRDRGQPGRSRGGRPADELMGRAAGDAAHVGDRRDRVRRVEAGSLQVRRARRRGPARAVRARRQGRLGRRRLRAAGARRPTPTTS